MDRKCDVPRDKCVTARSETGIATDAEVIQNPASGLNRTISVEDGNSSSETLDEPKTSNKSLYERICDLWLIRKIIGFFKRLLICSRKDADPCSTEPVKLSMNAVGLMLKSSMSAVSLMLRATTLHNEVCNLGTSVEAQDPPFDKWANAESSLVDFHARLKRLKNDISDLKSRSSDMTRKSDKTDSLVTQTAMRLNWLDFYIKDDRKDGYHDSNMRYYNAVITHACKIAKDILQGNKSQLDKLDTTHRNTIHAIDDEVKRGHAFAAVKMVETFRDAVVSLADSAGQADKCRQALVEWSMSVPRAKDSEQPAEIKTDPAEPQQ